MRRRKRSPEQAGGVMVEPLRAVVFHFVSRHPGHGPADDFGGAGLAQGPQNRVQVHLDGGQQALTGMPGQAQGLMETRRRIKPERNLHRPFHTRRLGPFRHQAVEFPEETGHPGAFQPDPVLDAEAGRLSRQRAEAAHCEECPRQTVAAHTPIVKSLKRVRNGFFVKS